MYKKYGANSFAYSHKTTDGETIIVFVSYGERCAHVDVSKKLTLFDNAFYSQTTRRNLYKFIYDFGENELQYNLYCAKNKKAFLIKMLEQKQIFFK